MSIKSTAQMKKRDLVMDFDYILKYMETKYKKKLADIDPRWPKNQEYIYENNFDYYIFKRLYEVLDIENRINELRNKYTSNNEKEKALDEIENNFHRIIKESLEIKDNSNKLLKTLNENFQKNKDIKYAKETYEKVCLGVLENVVKCYSDFKNRIIILDDEIKSLNN